MIIERSWRTAKEISPQMYEQDMAHAVRMNLPVFEWEGMTLDGTHTRVVWVAGPETGAVFSVYELS